MREMRALVGGLAAVIFAACSAVPSTPGVPSPSGPLGASASPSLGATTKPASPGFTEPPVSPGLTNPPVSPGPAPTARPVSGSGPWFIAGGLRDRGSDTYPPRLQVRVTVLGNGRVVVAGSDNVCTPGAAWNDSVLVDIGDPLTGSWDFAPSLSRPRDQFFMASLPGAAALIAGGTTDVTGELGPQSFSSTLRLDKNGTAWVRVGDLTVARSEPAGAVLADGRILLAGGQYVNEPAEGYRILGTAEIFDPASGTWARTGSLVTPRLLANAVTLADGRVLVQGGNGRAGAYGGDDPLLTAEIFDPTGGNWSPAGALPKLMLDASLVALPDGGALLVGPAGAYRFDASTRSWSRTSAMVTAAGDRAVVALADGRILAAGGYVRDVDSGDEYIRRAELYDPVLDQWVATDRMPAPRAGASAVLLDDGSVLLVGGWVLPGEGGAPNCPFGSSDVFRYVPG
jgi:hypothetical protein